MTLLGLFLLAIAVLLLMARFRAGSRPKST